MTTQQLVARAGGVRRLAVSLPAECWIALALVAMPLVLLAAGGSVDTAIRIVLWGIFGLGFDILFGYAGLLSFGQAAFFGSGSFVTRGCVSSPSRTAVEPGVWIYAEPAAEHDTSPRV